MTQIETLLRVAADHLGHADFDLVNGQHLDAFEVHLFDGTVADTDTLAAIRAAYDAYEPPVPVPQSVPMWAAKIVMQQHGVWDAIHEGIRATGNPVLLAAFENSPTMSRSSNAIAALAGNFGLTTDQIDAMFVAAGELANQV